MHVTDLRGFKVLFRKVIQLSHEAAGETGPWWSGLQVTQRQNHMKALIIRTMTAHTAPLCLLLRVCFFSLAFSLKTRAEWCKIYFFIRYMMSLRAADCCATCGTRAPGANWTQMMRSREIERVYSVKNDDTEDWHQSTILNFVKFGFNNFEQWLMFCLHLYLFVISDTILFSTSQI